MVALLVLISAIVFALIHSAPGGPMLLVQPGITAEQAAQMRTALGLDAPIPVQYVRWLGNALRGHFGSSLTYGQPVIDIVRERLPNTLTLGAAALVLALLVSLPVGVLSAVRRNSVVDHLGTLGAFFGMSIPVFWLGLLLIILFAVVLRWLPSSGMLELGAPFSVRDLLAHLLLPAITLSTTIMAPLTRYVRSSLLSVLNERYVQTARAKGLPEWRVILRHALGNALIPVVTVIGLQLPRLVGGAAVTESVFAWPGIGRLAVEGAFQRDYPMIMAVTLMVSVTVVTSNLVVDLLYGWLDPRISYTAAE
jgi:peptide/nickel transport system permease protein